MSFRINIGDVAEDEVQRSVESAFSPFFVFRSPPKKDRKEATDVLVPWDDVALLIESKAQALGPVSQRDPLNWPRKNLTQAARQIKGAARAIRDGRMTYMENALRGRVAFPSEAVNWLYGVIVVHHVSPPYDPFQLVPGLQQTTVPLHILSFRDFCNLAYFLDTPADLVNYLEERTNVLLPTLKPRVHEEERVFQYWLSNLEGLMAFRAEKLGEACTEEDVRAYAEHLRRLWAGDLPEAGAGAIIDHMIERAHEDDPDLGPLHVGEDIIEIQVGDPVRIATALSAIPRVRRIALGRRYLSAIQRAAGRQDDAWHANYSPKRSDCIFFLASPLPIRKREERRRRLLVRTKMLKHYRRVRKAIGIATEAGEDAGRSYDFVYLESDPVENEEAFLAAKALFGEGGRLLSDEPG